MAAKIDKYGVGIGQALQKTGIGAIAGVPLTVTTKALTTTVRLVGKTSSGLLKLFGATGYYLKKSWNAASYYSKKSWNAIKNLFTRRRGP